MYGRFLTPALFVLLTLLPAPARAQQALALDLARPLPAPQESLLMLDRHGEVLPLFAPRFSLTMVGGHQPLSYSGSRDGEVRVDDTLTAAFGAAIGFGVADLGICFPLHLVIAGERGGEERTDTRPGDLIVVPRVSLLPSGVAPITLVLSVPLTIPSGDETAFAGRHGFTAEPRLRFTVHHRRFTAAIRPGVVVQGGQNPAAPYLSDWLTMRASVGVGLGPGEEVTPEIGLDGLVPLGKPDAVASEVLGGVGITPIGGLRITAHGGFGLGTMPGIAAARVVVGVSWEGGIGAR